MVRSRRRTCIVALALVLAARAVSAQTPGRRFVTDAKVDARGVLHIIYSDRRVVTPPREKDQRGVSDVAVAGDKQTVGWLVQYDNHGITSYTIPLTLIVFRSGTVIRRVSNGFMVSEWFFADEGKRVAFHTDTVHSSLAPYYELRDVDTNQVVEKWEGALTDRAPAWTRRFRRE